ncbi:MAG: aspartate/glutamate racemase family protein [Solobacterium sp.]|nr:aspartate/glutamate racemase family protein [Erysipelotrichaceae bacterium]MBR3365462.1 aspartate/glutamate racemase family protein [Solobacterium sp.]
MKKLHFIYTTPNFYTGLYKPVMSREFDGRDDITVRFTMDNSLLLDTLANDVIPTNITKQRLLAFAQNAEKAGADCIVVGCTAVNTATKEIASLMDVPLFSVDEPMIQAILKDGHRKIAVLSHTPINAATIRRRLLAENSELQVDLFPVEGAKEAAEGEDYERLRELLQKGAESISDDYDCIACGHITAEDVDFSNVHLPVYRTGEFAIKEINRVLKG